MTDPLPIPIYGYRVVGEFPHDPTEYTEGLFYFDGFLYESGGKADKDSISNLRQVDITTGVAVRNVDLDPTIFAEGIAPWGNSIFMLTYENESALVFDINNLTRRRGNFLYYGQGWGLTQNGTSLIMSDGSPTILFRDPQTFTQTGCIEVKYGNEPWPGANELEYVNGEIWANMSGTSWIARISPSNGSIVGWIDLDELYPERPGMMNGIAYDAEHDRIFVTGKLWPKLFQIVVTLPEY
jgi:glutaminyl-peptide cyclotransferase